MKSIKNLILLIFLLPTLFIQAKAMEEEIYTHVHIVNYDHPLSFEEIKSRYTAYDKTDGNITDQILFQSDYEKDYEENKLSLKNYSLYVSVTNSRNRTTEWVDEISVRDFTSPVLHLKETEISIDASKDNLEEMLSSLLLFSDNYDTTFEIYNFEGIEKVEQGAGTYSICCRVTDSSGNVSNEALLIVHVYETIQKQIVLNPILIDNKVFSSNELLALFLQNNTIDTSYLSAQVQSTYLDTPDKQGIYQAEFIFNYADETQQIYQCKIINTISEKKKKDDTIIYISLSCIILLSGIGIFIYRKRR